MLYFNQQHQVWKFKFLAAVVGHREKSLCLQYTHNVSRDLVRSLRDLEREMVVLQTFADSTGERRHVEVFKAKKEHVS